MTDLIGQTLGQYKLISLIGKGGMATVYRAHQISMARDVAIKIMAEELTNNEEFVTRFERDASVIAKLQHPHILPVIDFGRTDQYIYLVMRYVAGGVLSDRLLETTLTVQQVDRFLSQISSALEYAHRQGIVHRDLKPTNVLLDEQDNTYLTDFGIAKMLAGSTSRNLTATGRVMGTPSYMAPEQWRNKPVDARTDIYALGIILYEMLLGAQPFYAETPYGMMYKHFDTPPPLPRLINPHLPEAVEQVVLHALAKQPSERYASATEMAKAFTEAIRMVPPDALKRPLPRATVEDINKATSLTMERQWSGKKPDFSSPAHGAASITQTTDFVQATPDHPALQKRPTTPPLSQTVKVFISYSRTDKDFAQRLANDLEKQGADVWIDVQDIAPGTTWAKEIQDALDTSDVMLLLVSKASMQSENVEDEWMYFKNELGKTIIPLKLDPTRLPFQLHKLNYIDFHTQDYDTAFAQLVTGLRAQKSD